MIYYTIIIPHKNIPNLLARCIDSIPDRKDIQIIVVDDNSDIEKQNFSDYTWIQRNNIEIFYTKEGKGAGYARNYALKYAKGKWIIFADADDFFSPKFNDILNQFINQNFDVIYFKTSSVDSETLLPSNRDILFNTLIDEYLFHKIDSHKLGFGYVSPWGKIYSHELITKKHIRFEEVLTANDLLFTVLITLFQSKIKVTNDILYTITTRRGSLVDTLFFDEKKFDSRLSAILRANQVLLENGYENYRYGVFKYIIKSYHFGIKKTLKTIKLIFKSSTPIFYGWKKHLSLWK